MTRCYICGDEINENNETEEHIVLNAIGGNLKSKELICAKCNSEFGEKIDAELAKQLNHLCNMLNIQRDRKKVPNLEAKSKESGESILVMPGGKPLRKMPKINKSVTKDGKESITILAPDMKSAKKAIKGLKRKHNEIDINNVLATRRQEREYLKEIYEIDICIGGERAFCAIGKMAVNFYMLKVRKFEYIEHLINYLKCENGLELVQYYYKKYDIIPKDQNEILHSIIIKGDKNEGLLLAYIELFNCYKFIVILNENYTGENVNVEYYFDVLNRIEVNKQNNFEINRNDILYLFREDDIPAQDITREVNKVLLIADKKQGEEIISGITQRVFDKIRNKYPEFNDIATEEFISEVSEEFVIWLANIQSKKYKY